VIINLLLLLVCVVNHNSSATKQRLHPQSVAEISRHSVLLIKALNTTGFRFL